MSLRSSRPASICGWCSCTHAQGILQGISRGAALVRAAAFTAAWTGSSPSASAGHRARQAPDPCRQLCWVTVFVCRLLPARPVVAHGSRAAARPRDRMRRDRYPRCSTPAAWRATRRAVEHVLYNRVCLAVVSQLPTVARAGADRAPVARAGQRPQSAVSTTVRPIRRAGPSARRRQAAADGPWSNALSVACRDTARLESFVPGRTGSGRARCRRPVAIPGAVLWGGRARGDSPVAGRVRRRRRAGAPASYVDSMRCGTGCSRAAGLDLVCLDGLEAVAGDAPWNEAIFRLHTLSRTGLAALTSRRPRRRPG